MTDEQTTSGVVSDPAQDFIGQLRAVTEGMETWPDSPNAAAGPIGDLTGNCQFMHAIEPRERGYSVS
jgi:hypothetical protein